MLKQSLVELALVLMETNIRFTKCFFSLDLVLRYLLSKLIGT